MTRGQPARQSAHASFMAAISSPSRSLRCPAMSQGRRDSYNTLISGIDSRSVRGDHHAYPIRTFSAYSGGTERRQLLSPPVPIGTAQSPSNASQLMCGL